ncbi:probable tRNA (uracil-O(2)-)-methyltransferase isoform X2 [Argiope bruennichi]|uniref:probable tRNA (uracil-O(2)-)-methyltransferase isoform X2 n=1 Tax=Argiope bruennichi TaxID=94029 RepID=UPI002494A482|nr:probable tRNA (uracil-O(2)-)-methyltransferase isoform X2 [Argiope bruennichi]
MNSNWQLIDEKVLLANQKFDFYDGVNVYVTRPHILNQKVSAVEILEDYTNVLINNELLRHLEEDFVVEEVKEILGKGEVYYTVQESPAYSEHSDVAHLNENRLIFRSLIPRQLNIYQEVMEVVILNPKEVSIAFYPKRSDVLKSRITPVFPYKITYVENRSSVKLEILQPSYKEPRHDESVQWLKSKVFPKIIKWCQEIPKSPVIPSLKLLSAKDYNVNLHYLKSKYADKFVKIWPEYNNTDPIKYVYEDIAIAAYLITLWNREREEMQLSQKQTFIDLGCGNGLLDHILSSEGHKGMGIDLRRRKIWDVYGPETILIEKVIQPNDKQRYPGYDWIIGNHADELTPWIPVIASRSSYDMKVFLLPCCFYTFDGKYERIHHKETQYQSYLKFLLSLCTTMGFHAEIDKLRIPSTKRIMGLEVDSNDLDELLEEYNQKYRRFKELHSISQQNT